MIKVTNISNDYVGLPGVKLAPGDEHALPGSKLQDPSIVAHIAKNLITAELLDPIIRVPMPLANTEYSVTFITGVTNCNYKTASKNTKSQVGWVPGGSGTNYITIHKGTEYRNPDNLDVGGHTLYFQSNKANQVAEIEVS